MSCYAAIKTYMAKVMLENTNGPGLEIVYVLQEDCLDAVRAMLPMIATGVRITIFAQGELVNGWDYVIQ